MKKIILLTFLVVSLALCACGNTAQPESKPSDTESVSEAESLASEPETQTESEAPAAEPVNPLSEGEEETQNDGIPVVPETIEEAGIDAFVTLPDYKGMELVKTVYPVTEEDIDQAVADQLSAYPLELPEDTLIEEGMVANIDYAGTVDGAPFDGGSAQGYDLAIGSHAFVEGFEDQLIGHKKGDTVDVVVNFPETYYEKLAGKEAHFAVTINAVKEVPAEPTEDWLSEHADGQTLEEYRNELKELLQKENDEASEGEMRYDAWEKLVAEAEYHQYPQELIDKYAKLVREQMTEMARIYYNTTLDTFMQENGISEQEFTESAKEYVQRELIADCVMIRTGLGLENQLIEEKKQYLLEINDLASVEAAEEAGVMKEQLDYAARNNAAIDIVLETAKITEQQGTEE